MMKTDVNLTLKFVLERNNFKVDTFTNPLEALQNFRSSLYDLVLLDVKMPVMNGFGLCHSIRKLDDKVKICFLTAASTVYYEGFGKHAFPDTAKKCIIQKRTYSCLIVALLGRFLELLIEVSSSDLIFALDLSSSDFLKFRRSIII